MDGFPLTMMCGRIRIRISKRIRTPTLCGEYLSWVFIYLLRGEEEMVLDILEMLFDIRAFRKSYSWEIMCFWH
jgi:hypothetical protein